MNPDAEERDQPLRQFGAPYPTSGHVRGAPPGAACRGLRFTAAPEADGNR